MGLVEADRESIAVALGSPGLTGDVPERRVQGRGHAAENAGDIPARDRLRYPAGPSFRRPHAVHCFVQSRHGSSPSEAGIERRKIAKRDPEPALAGGWSRSGFIRERDPGAGIAQVRDELLRADFIEQFDRRKIQRQLQRAPRRHGALEGMVEIFRRVSSVMSWPVVQKGFRVPMPFAEASAQMKGLKAEPGERMAPVMSIDPARSCEK
jgi:hypothetical protein